MSGLAAREEWMILAYVRPFVGLLAVPRYAHASLCEKEATVPQTPAFEVVHATLNHDSDGPWFDATIVVDGGLQRWVALPLDTIPLVGAYEGRLQLVGQYGVNITEDHQPRERSVQCSKCNARTFNHNAICDNHKEA